MPVYERFEDLPVWKLAKDLAVEIYQITKGDKFRRDYALAGQIRRAAISVSSNIAEGFERGSRKEFIQFLYIAKGSLGEIRSQLQVCFELGYVNKDKLNALLSRTYDLSNQVGAFISSIKRRIKSQSVIRH
jgi:four helix bundle protein